MVAFTAKVSHLQTALNALDDTKKAAALSCIEALPATDKADTTLVDPTYTEHW